MGPDIPGQIIVMGHGRSGTTFLLRMLGLLGFDTGGIDEWFRTAEAHRGDPAPQVAKGMAGMCLDFKKYRKNFKLDPIRHVFLMVRPREAIVESGVEFLYGGGKERGPRHFKNMNRDQAREFIRKGASNAIGTALMGLVEADVPFTIVAYPKAVMSADYLYDCINSAVGPIDREEFDEVFNGFADPRKVHF